MRPSLQTLTNGIDKYHRFTYKTLKNFEPTRYLNGLRSQTVYAGVVKLVDALDSKSSPPCEGASSILASGTNSTKGDLRFKRSGSPLLFLTLKELYDEI